MAANAVPITVREFFSVLEKTVPRKSKALGMAISGGVDSMALASLCAKVMQQESNYWQFRAFVVDHGARPGSKEEAQAVCEVLQNKGIQSNLLSIEWPKSTMPSRLTNFESLARKHRYQALGRACKNYNIGALLLAHHEDDQMETMIMRLASGHRGRLLRTTKSGVGIPECEGMYGLHQSGKVEVQNFHGQRGRFSGPESTVYEGSCHGQPLWNNDQIRGAAKVVTQSIAAQSQIRSTVSDEHNSIYPLDPMQEERGGILIYRPFLSFSKKRLLATCLEHDMPWFEDLTNKDRTLTLRNSIRHIVKNHSLPVALQKPSLLRLQDRIQQVTAWRTAQRDWLLTESRIRCFEVRSGKLIIRFVNPSFAKTCSFPSSITPASVLVHQQDVASSLLRLVVDTVTPKERASRSDWAVACQAVFPGLFPQLKKKNTDGFFTIAGVECKRLDLPKSFLVDTGLERSQTDGLLLQDHEWLFTRQPYRSNISLQPLLEIPPAVTPFGYSVDWNLYDGRYWIRVHNYTSNTLRVRPLRKGDLSSFKKELDNESRNILVDRLKTLAPGPIRYTMPAIVMVEPGGTENILTLPTLEVAIPGAKNKLHYEIRYKAIHPIFSRDRHISEVNTRDDGDGTCT